MLNALRSTNGVAPSRAQAAAGSSSMAAAAPRQIIRAAASSSGARHSIQQQAALPFQQQHMHHHQQQQPLAAPQLQQLQQQQHYQRSSSCSSRVVARSTDAAAPAHASLSSVDLDELVGPSALEPEVFEIVTYALKLAWTAETYYVHSWMLLLGLLKNEKSTAAQVLRELGLDDLYGAWNEVLWALNAADGLTPRAFTPRMTWGERASLVLQGAVRYGGWAGRPKVTAEDLLVAFAASDVLTSLFPDLDLSFERVRRAVEKRSGVTYALPAGIDGGAGGALTSQDNFL